MVAMATRWLFGVMMLATMRITTSQLVQTPMNVTVTAILETPYLMAKTRVIGNSSVEEYSGFMMDILDELSMTLNISFELTLNKEMFYGRRDSKTGKWNGLIGELVDKRVDMAVGAITVSPRRDRVVDFGIPFQTFERVAIVKDYVKSLPPAPVPPSPSLAERMGLFFSPLEHSVWLLTGLSWLVSSLVLYLVCRANPYEWRQMVKDREATLREGESFNCVNSYWFTIGAIFWQGFMRSPRSMGGRIVVTAWWIFTLIFVAMYISSLTCLLQSGMFNTHSPVGQNVPKVPKIRNLLDITNNPHIKIAIFTKGATANYLRTSKDPMANLIWRRLSLDGLPSLTLEDGVERVRQSTPEQPLVYIGESAMANYFVRRKPCEIYTVPGFPFIGSYAFAYPDGSKLRKKINAGLTDLKERGIMERLEKKWFPGECRPHLPADEATTNDIVQVQYPPFKKIDVASFSGALIALIVGLCLGFLVTLVEKLIFINTERVHTNENEGSAPA